MFLLKPRLKQVYNERYVNDLISNSSVKPT